MARDVSLTARQAIYAQETDEAFIVLLTIDHAELSDPIRVANYDVNVVSRGSLTATDLTSNNYHGTLNRIEVWDRGLIEIIPTNMGVGAKGVEQDTSYYITVPNGALDTLTDFTIEGLIRQKQLDGIDRLTRDLGQQIDEALTTLLTP